MLTRDNLYKGAGKLLTIVDINKDSFYKKINNRGLNFDKALTDGLVDKFIHNLKIISEQPVQEPLHKNFFENKDITNFPDMFEIYFFMIVTIIYLKSVIQPLKTTFW